MAQVPLVTNADIASVTKRDNGIFIELGSDLFKKFALLPVGTPFAICRGLNLVCVGVVWSDTRQASVDGVVAIPNHLPGDSTAIQIRTGYPARKFFTGTDPTETILSSLGFPQ